MPTEKAMLLLGRARMQAKRIEEQTGRRPTRVLLSREDAQGTEIVLGPILLEGELVVDASYLVPPGFIFMDVDGPTP